MGVESIDSSVKDGIEKAAERVGDRAEDGQELVLDTAKDVTIAPFKPGRENANGPTRPSLVQKLPLSPTPPFVPALPVVPALPPSLSFPLAPTSSTAPLPSTDLEGSVTGGTVSYEGSDRSLDADVGQQLFDLMSSGQDTEAGSFIAEEYGLDMNIDEVSIQRNADGSASILLVYETMEFDFSGFSYEDREEHAFEIDFEFEPLGPPALGPVVQSGDIEAIAELSELDEFASDNTFAFLVATMDAPGEDAPFSAQDAYNTALENVMSANNGLEFDQDNNLIIPDTATLSEIAEKAEIDGLPEVRMRATYLLGHLNTIDLSGVDDQTLANTLVDALTNEGLDPDTALTVAITTKSFLLNDSFHPDEALFLADFINDVTGLDGTDIMMSVVETLYDTTGTPQHGRHLTGALMAAQVYDNSAAVVPVEAPALGPTPSMNSVNELRQAVTGLEETTEGLEFAEGVEVGVGVSEEIGVAEEVLALFAEALPETAALGPAALGIAFAGVVVTGLAIGLYQSLELRDQPATFALVKNLSRNLQSGAEILAQSARTGQVPTDAEINELNTIFSEVKQQADDLGETLINHPHVSQQLKNQANAMGQAVDDLYEDALNGPLGLFLEPLSGGQSPAQHIEQSFQQAIFGNPELSPLLGAAATFDFQLIKGTNGQFATEFVLTVMEGTELTGDQIRVLTATANDVMTNSAAVTADINFGINLNYPAVLVRTPTDAVVYETPRVESFFEQTQDQRLESGGFTHNLYETLTDPDNPVVAVFDQNGGLRFIPAGETFDDSLASHGYPDPKARKELGHGVSGIVYPYESDALGPLALKFQTWLSASSSGKPELAVKELDKILSESFIHLQASQVTLDGRPIALPLHDVVISGDQIVSVIERAAGKLEDHLEFSATGSAFLQLDKLAEVAELVASLHSAGYSHSDIKLDNILYTEDDDLYLSDFGLSKKLTNLSDADLGRVLGDDSRSFAKMIYESTAIEALGIFDEFVGPLGTLSPSTINEYVVDTDTTDWQVKLKNLFVQLWKGELPISGDSANLSLAERIDEILSLAGDSVVDAS